MTFARSVKEELVHLETNEAEQLAELAALLHINGELVINKEGRFINFKTVNLAIARRFFKLVKRLYKAEMEIFSQQTSFKKNEIIVMIKSKVQTISSENCLLAENINDYELIIQTTQTKQAYLRGAFLASGSINDPITPNYHLEIFVKDEKTALFIVNIIKFFDLNAKIAKRRLGFVVYLKEAESISEFLKIIGAYEGVFKYEDLRIQRDFTNSINRLINCEVANEKKTLKAANEQLLQIKFVRKYRNFKTLDEKTQEIIILREENPAASLTELTALYFEKTGDNISKSGINHRFQKLKELSSEIAQGLYQQNQAKE